MELAAALASADARPIDFDFAAAFNAWMREHIEGRYAQAGHYTHEQLRTLMYLAFQNGAASADARPSEETTTVPLEMVCRNCGHIADVTPRFDPPTAPSPPAPETGETR